jgi:hypothetical protein
MTHLLLAIWFLGLAPAAGEAPASRPTASRPAALVELAPGVRIDIARRTVELDGQVVLREGPLELFACSPNTREYESIVRIDAVPTLVYQAIGMLGVEPGRPLEMDAAGHVTPASGDPLTIDVRYRDQGADRTVPIEEWMTAAPLAAGPVGDVPSAAPASAATPPARTAGRPGGAVPTAVPRQAWVFAGSRRTAANTLTADEDGTVIAVVDFDSALIALPAAHSASNAQLWLEPRTPAIPAVGTRCTLLIRPLPWTLRVDARGALTLLDPRLTPPPAGRRVSSGQLGRHLEVLAAQPAPAWLAIEIDPRCPDWQARLICDLLAHHRVEARPFGATTSAPCR